MEKVKPHIVICDDEEDILDLCRIILQPDYEITSIQQCGEVVSEIERIHPDLILMDLWLCGYKGEDIINELRQMPGLRDIPVIIFSAKDNLEKIAAELHVEGLLHKPFTGKQLLSIIHHYAPETGSRIS